MNNQDLTPIFNDFVAHAGDMATTSIVIQVIAAVFALFTFLMVANIWSDRHRRRNRE